MAVQPETLDSFDDRRLVAAFQAGEEDAFARIVGTHYSSLMAEARRRLRTVGDAEDAVQETLLRAYLALDRFGGEYHLRAWLSRILSNACADAASRRAGELRLYDRLATRREDVPPADDGLDADEVRKLVREAVDALPDSYRIAFVLREVEERPYAEVAETLSVTEPNARARVHRARSVLQKSLRGTSATLGGILIPLRLWVPRWVGSGRLSRQVAKTAANLHPEAAGTGPAVGVGQRPAGSFSTVSQAPLSQVSQALGQAVTSPMAQTFVAVAPEVGRSALPVAGALATLAAASAAMVVPATMNLPSAAASAPVPHVSAAPSGSLTSFDSPDPSTPSGTSAPASAPTVTISSNAVADPSDLWTWVSDAAGGAAGIVVGASSSNANDSTGPAQTTGQGAGGNTAGAPTGPACPWVQSFPAAGLGASLPPAVLGGAGATVFYSTGTISLPSTGASFEASGSGQASESEDGSGQQSLVTAVFGACLPSTSAPALLANLTETQDLAADTLQLRGALVALDATGNETDALYRGTAVWLEGPGVGGTPVPFVAEVALDQPAGIVVLRVAFFGSEDELLAPTPASTSGVETGGPSTSTCSPASTVATSSNCGSGGSTSADPSSGQPASSPSDSETSSGSSDTTGTSSGSGAPTGGSSVGSTSTGTGSTSPPGPAVGTSASTSSIRTELGQF